ncbi:hypothetical protein CDN99_24200 [Roseateles aquatilis]|uniref:Uncharacterized protein n=1 Tax=Roseateles aquatilis TaxID=431061 RepID=A0A246IW01_9BURK|nr:hypothetical protein [Roseateles aquatilis]OWQ84401.1 hypothetical protein CDN99_24200 [Roseateles aquatilis]
MKTVNRDTLKNYFRDGQMPSQRHFEALIDSMLNMNDEGFRKSVERGDEIYAPVGHDALMSFFRDQQPEDPLWQLRLGRTNDQLQVHVPSTTTGAVPPPPVLALDSRQRVGLGTDDPRTRLDVRGVVASEGRVGNFVVPDGLVANGRWQALTPALKGCQGFEVMAGAGVEGTGHFGLLHAIALSTFNPTPTWFPSRGSRRGIRQTQAWWGRRCDRVELRWMGSQGRDASYHLEIRSGCNFGDDVPLVAQVTQLWFLPTMLRQRPRADAPSEPGP